MTKVMVFGSFDPLHKGHRSLFRQAREQGRELVVILSRDASIRRIKGREPRQAETNRVAAVQACPEVDKAMLGNEDDFLRVVEEEEPDVLVLGYDQQVFAEEELRKMLCTRGLHPRIVRAKAYQPEQYKSSRIVKNQ